MFRVPHRLCQASSRGSNSIIFSCVVSFSSCAGTLFIGFPIVFCLSKSLVFSASKLKISSHQISLKSSLCSLGTVPRIFFNSLCEPTFEPVVRIWVPRRLCLLISSGWVSLPSPCVMDSGFHIVWPLLIPPRILHLLADRKLRSLEIPFPPQDQSSTL